MSLNPITREEKFLAKAGGEDVGELKPITRKEKFLDKIAGGGSGGASSWNDLKDKPFYDNGVKFISILENPELAEIDGKFAYASPVEGIEAGEEYTVKYNGVDYVCTAKSGDLEGMSVVCLGNGEPMGFETSTEPFLLGFFPPEMVSMVGAGLVVMPLDGATTVSISIYGKKEDIKKLDNKYLDLEWLPATTEKEILPPMELTTNSTKLPIRFNDLINYDTAVIYFDGVRYERPITHSHIEGDSDCGIHLSDGVGEGNMNWLIRLSCGNSDGRIMYLGTGTHTLSISVLVTEPLPEKFLPAGGGIKTAIIKQDGYDDVLAGVSATASGGDETTYTCANMTFEEAVAILKSGEPLAVMCMIYANGQTTCFYMPNVVRNIVDIPFPMITLVDNTGDMILYWTAETLSDTRPSL